MKIGVIFDLDGTLMDTLADLHSAVNHTLRQYGCPERSVDAVRRFVGNGARRLIELSLPGTDNDPAVDRVLADFQTYYNANCRGQTRPYPGVSEALTQIRAQYPVAVVSNKPDPAVKALCGEYFPGVYALGVTEGCPRKPARDMLVKAMAAMDVETCVYVGDSEVDIAAARNTGLPCLSVLWGFRDRQELEEAGGRYFCADAKDLPSMVEQIIKIEL